jgi:hypothetical protein
MKRILTTMAIALIATGVFAQGTIYTLNGTGYLAISTNNLYGGVGVTRGTGYIYALFENASADVTNGIISQSLLNNTNPLDSATWTFSGIYMTNINGGLLTGGTSVVDNMWAYNTTNAYFIAGWSVSYGTTWGEISNQLASGMLGLLNYGFYGVSQVGFGQPGGGSPSNPVFHIFGGASGQGTGVSGFTLYPNVPEPGTLALTSLGGLSLLLFRRRRS